MDKKKIEEYLTGYKSMVSRAEVLSIKEGIEDYSLQAYSYSEVKSDTNEVFSDVEQFVTDKMDKLDNGVSDELKNLLEEIRIINVSLQSLTDEEYGFVQERYFKQTPSQIIADDWGMTRRNLYYYRERVLEKLYNHGMQYLFERSKNGDRN